MNQRTVLRYTAASDLVPQQCTSRATYCQRECSFIDLVFIPSPMIFSMRIGALAEKIPESCSVVVLLSKLSKLAYLHSAYGCDTEGFLHGEV
jgi:hypothetical protein